VGGVTEGLMALHGAFRKEYLLEFCGK
jgi:hypothetical protein